jgi:hypothetical protein
MTESDPINYSGGNSNLSDAKRRKADSINRPGINIKNIVVHYDMVEIDNVPKEIDCGEK